MVGWGTRSPDSFEVSFDETKASETHREAGVVSQYQIIPEPDGVPGSAEEETPETQPATSTAPSDRPAPEPVQLAPILEFAEKAPTLTGGLGSLYVRIRYPQAAIDEGIEGQLVLRFVVETDGRVSDIVVEKSLHPLCDSAAVRALREVAFVPGRHNGETARVRMRLPVRFQIVRNGRVPVQDSTLAKAL